MSFKEKKIRDVKFRKWIFLFSLFHFFPFFFFFLYSFFLSLFLFFSFCVPGEPHAHGIARLKIWNQCDQNGCYGRAPVYRTVLIRLGAGCSLADDSKTSKGYRDSCSPRFFLRNRIG